MNWTHYTPKRGRALIVATDDVTRAVLFDDTDVHDER